MAPFSAKLAEIKLKKATLFIQILLITQIYAVLQIYDDATAAVAALTAALNASLFQQK